MTHWQKNKFFWLWYLDTDSTLVNSKKRKSVNGAKSPKCSITNISKKSKNSFLGDTDYEEDDDDGEYIEDDDENEESNEKENDLNSTKNTLKNITYGSLNESDI